MPSRLRKIQKPQGHVRHGPSRMGKRRKHPGGQGNAGGVHDPTGSTLTNNTEVTGESWFEALLNEQTQINAARNKAGAAPMIDVLRSGSTKFWERESFQNSLSL
uniref:60S ribosomal protein L27a-like n=1 Tax=Nyctereutes procyonoides TaxID=34880 RepID=UPI002444CBF4|nr:60S ribosomal protein L27a-like [Nyctereutes procyonoides]